MIIVIYLASVKNYYAEKMSENSKQKLESEENVLKSLAAKIDRNTRGYYSIYSGDISASVRTISMVLKNGIAIQLYAGTQIIFVNQTGTRYDAYNNKIMPSWGVEVDYAF